MIEVKGRVKIYGKKIKYSAFDICHNCEGNYYTVHLKTEGGILSYVLDKKGIVDFLKSLEIQGED
jgi:hypothetical protein